MNYIILDLEFNSYFRFEEQDVRNHALPYEIIQIGAIKLDEEFNIIDHFNQFIKPIVYSRVNPYIKKVTKIRTRHLESGLSFLDALNQFNYWIGCNYILCSWGKKDMQVLMENCTYFECLCPKLDRIIDIQDIYVKYKNLSKLPALKEAVINFGIEESFPYHVAKNDAKYAYTVLKRLRNEINIEILDFKAILNEAIENDELLLDMINELRKLRIKCPRCGRFANKFHRQFTSRNKPNLRYLHGKCLNCKINIQYVIKISKTPNNLSYSIKRIRTNDLIINN